MSGSKISNEETYGGTPDLKKMITSSFDNSSQSDKNSPGAKLGQSPSSNKSSTYYDSNHPLGSRSPGKSGVIYSENSPLSGKMYSENSPLSGKMYSENSPSGKMYSENSPLSGKMFGNDNSSHRYGDNSPGWKDKSSQYAPSSIASSKRSTDDSDEGPWKRAVKTIDPTTPSPVGPLPLTPKSMAAKMSKVKDLARQDSGEIPSPKAKRRKELLQQESEDLPPCIDRSLEEIPEALTKEKKSRGKRSPAKKSKRPISLCVTNPQTDSLNNSMEDSNSANNSVSVQN